jgi:hypothetical protein
MTQPPPGHPPPWPPPGQPGYQPPYPPAPQQQPYPPQHPQYPGHPHYRQPRPGQPLPRPAQVGTAITLSYVLAALGIGVGIYILVLGVVENRVVGAALFALVFLLLGGLNVIAAMSLAHRTFPNVMHVQMASGFIAALGAINLVRSITRGFAEPVPAIGTLVIVGVAGTALYLVGRPEVRQWMVATHQKSLAEGHVPRNHRRR